MKTCSKCGERKPLSDFNLVSSPRSKGKYPRGDCKVCQRSRVVQWKENHAESLAEYNARYYRSNKRRHQSAVKAIRLASPDRWNAKTARRRAAKLQRTPPWCNLAEVQTFYSEAARLTELTGIAFHVDHIIPLQGDLVSGLHVPANLQLLPASDNLSKSNSFTPG